jgi:V/A-type H+/Na+-transporting ATPase subunit I
VIRQMAAVEVLGPLGSFADVVRQIQETGLLHIVEVPLMGEEGSPRLHRIHLPEDKEQERAVLEELASTLDDAVANVPPAVAGPLQGSRDVAAEYARWEGRPVSALAAAARVLHATVRSIGRRERNLADDLRLLAAYEEVAAALAPLVERRELSGGYEFLGLVFGPKSHLATAMLKLELDKLTAGDYRFHDSPLPSGGAAVVIGFRASRSTEVRGFVAQAGIAEMSLPRYLKDKPFVEALASMGQDIDELRRKQERVERQAREFYEEHAHEIVAMRDLCHDLLGRFHVLDSFARTDHVFVIRGWLPSGDLRSFAARVRQSMGESIVVRAISTRALGTPPVALDNPRPSRSFEPLLSLQPLPKYGSIDPTGFVATFFPPMFGLMLADIGYGAIVAVASLIMYLKGRKKRNLLAKLGVVAGLCSFFTIVFGAVFGELFGNFGEHLGLHPLWQQRFVQEGPGVAKALLSYLGIAIGMGVLHVLLGLVLGVFNARRFRDKHAILNNLSRIAGIFVIFLAVGLMVKVLPPVFTTVEIVFVVVFAVLMIYQAVHDPVHGLLLPIEVLGAVGNILSYARIMAIGVASAVLALVANRFASMISNVIVAAVVVLLVHALNLALGILDPTIQGMRLQYVEFFSKFYRGGGKEFSPFRKIGGVIA